MKDMEFPDPKALNLPICLSLRQREYSILALHYYFIRQSKPSFTYFLTLKLQLRKIIHSRWAAI